MEADDRFAKGILGAFIGYLGYILALIVSDVLGLLSHHPTSWWLRLIARAFAPLAVFQWGDFGFSIRFLALLSYSFMAMGFFIGWRFGHRIQNRLRGTS